jgi:predicted nucleic acid-binding Zn ribbon protein
VSDNDPANRATGRTRGVASSTSGDNPVDGVDKSVTRGVRESLEQGTPDHDPASGETPVGGDGHAPRGSDLARAALEAARSAAKEKAGKPRPRLTPSGQRRRRRWSGPRPDDRDPQPLGRLASRVALEHGWSNRLAGGMVFGRWAALVGADVAEHARPVSLRDGELTVQAASTAWATQLRLLQSQLLRKIAAGVGPNVVRLLKIHGPTAPSWRYGPRHVSGRGPRDTYG